MNQKEDDRADSTSVIGAMEMLRKELKIALVARSVPNAYKFAEGEDALRQLEDLIGDIKCLKVRVNINRKLRRSSRPPRYAGLDPLKQVDDFNARFTRIQSKIACYVEDHRVKNSGRVLIRSGAAGRKLGDWANSIYQSRPEV